MTWKEFKASVEQQQLDDEMEVGWINWNSPEPTKTNKGLHAPCRLHQRLRGLHRRARQNGGE